MKQFPEHLRPDNIKKLVDANYNRLKCYLRRDLYEHIISHSESDYFSLDEFNQRVNNMDTTKKLVEEVILELKELGWNCQLSFGGTGLFVYGKEKPKECWDGDTLS